MKTRRMPLEGWLKVRTYSLLGCLALLAARAAGARPRFDTSTDMGLVLVPQDAEVDSVIFRLRATDQDADFPLVFDITATVTPVVRIENLPCTLYNKICQANVILTRRLTPGRLHDFAVRVRDSKGDSNSMQATISVTNATTQRDKIFPHIPAIIMVPEDTKPGKELDYILVRSNQWSGKPVYIELWQPKELFTIRQRQTPAETRGVITLIGELDFETQSMYTLTMYATDPYTEPKKDTRNIAGLHLVVVVQDVQDVPPIFTLAPPLTKINNTVQPGDVILRVHAEDGDKGVPREVTYGLVSEGNPFTPFFNITETTGEIILARPLEELTQITHVGAPVVLSVVAEEIRRSTMEPPAQATVVEVGLLLGEPGNSPPFFENDNYVAWMDENAEPGSVVTFTEHYTTKVRDEDIGKAGVFALKLENNNGTFEISPTVAERTANFIITVRDNSLIDYEIHKSLRFKIVAQEVGPATNLSATVPATIFLRDVNDNAPEFEEPAYEVTLSENVTAGTRVIQVHATDKDTGSFGRIQYTRIIGTGSEAFVIDPDTGIITVAMGTSALDREITASLQLSVEARDEDGKGLRGTVPLVVNLLDVNDNAPVFEVENYQFTLNDDMTNFTMPAIIKAIDADAEPPNNEVRYELVHGNYENKFYLDEITGEIFLREPVNKVRRTRHNTYQNFATKFRKGFAKVQKIFQNMSAGTTVAPVVAVRPFNVSDENITDNSTSEDEGDDPKIRRKREDDDVLFTLTARAYDLGVPHMSGLTQVSVLRGPVAGARNVMFVVAGENPDPAKTAETLAAITGGRIVVQEIRPYTSNDVPSGAGKNVPSLEGGKKSIVVARVEPIGAGASLVDIERIRTALAANGVGVIGGDMSTGSMETEGEGKSASGGTTNKNSNTNTNTNTNTNITTVHNEEVTIYRAENRLLFWLLIILGLLMLIALIALIICCICPGCPFYMAPRKRRVHSSETLIARSDGRPKRHLQRKHPRMMEATWQGKKQAWSADPTRRNWQFNRRNHRAPGLASLPGDVLVVDRDHEAHEKAASLRLRDGPVPMYLTDPARRQDEERIYMEDVEGGLRAQGYGVVDVESLRQHDVERSSEMARQVYMDNEQEQQQRASDKTKFVMEQHFYRDGNAEVLRLVTRGQTDEGMIGYPAHRPSTLVIDQGQPGSYRVDGKDILLQRFIEDQKMRHASGVHDLHDSLQDIERRSMESHQRQKEAISLQHQQQQQLQQQQLQQQQVQHHQQQQKILLIPERLEEDHRQHIEELGPDVQRLIIDHGGYDKTRFEARGSQEFAPGATLLVHATMPKVAVEKPPDQTPMRSVNVQHYSIHDLELARQNALLTRLLLERDSRDVGVGATVDSASYLETQSLPGQVAIATQTDRTAATQTELPSRSRSDNDESEEEARMRKKLRSKKRHADAEPRRIRTLWMKSPIKEEDASCSNEKRANILRKRMMKDVKDSRRISLEPDVLREISDSLDENGEPPTRRRDEAREDLRVESRDDDDSGRLEDSSSMELTTRDGRRIVPEKRKVDGEDEEAKRRSHRSQREVIVEPSFRILEKEMSSLSKKLSKLAGKKILQSTSNGSETDSQEKTKTVAKDSKVVEKKIQDSQVAEQSRSSKVTEVVRTKRSKSTARTTVAEGLGCREQAKETLETKPRQVSKYRKSQTISTGSSDLEDVADKPKKQHPQVVLVEKQKLIAAKSSHVKLKRQSKVEHKRPGKAVLVAVPQETQEQKETSDSASKSSNKSGKNRTSEGESMTVKKCSSGSGEGKTESGPMSSASSDNAKDAKVKRTEEVTVDVGRKRTVDGGETSGQASREETLKISPSGSGKTVLVTKTVIETKRESPEALEVDVKIVPGTIKVVKSDGIRSPVDKEVLVESTPTATTSAKASEDKEERFDAIKEHVFTMPKEALNDFLAHEMKDSLEESEAQRHSVAEGAERIKDIILGAMSIESEDRKGDAVIREGHDDIELKESRGGDAVREEEAGPSEVKGKEIAIATQKAGPVSSDLIEEKSKDFPRREELFEPTELRDYGRAILLEKKVVDLIVLEDKERQDVLQIKDVSDIKFDDRESINFVGAEDPSYAVKLEDKVAVELVRKEKMPEPAKTEDEESPVLSLKDEAPAPAQPSPSPVAIKSEYIKTADVIREEEAPGSVKMEDKESTDAIRKDEPPEFMKSEDKESVHAIRKGESPEIMKLEDKESVVAIRKDKAPESMKMDDEKSVDIIQKEETPEPTKLEDKESSDIVPKEKMAESTKLESSDNFEEWGDVSKDTSEAEQKVEKQDVVAQQSEDAGMFSDNFDSFCGTVEHPKGSLDTQGSGEEFSYETLQSESSEERVDAKKMLQREDAVDKDDAVKTIDEPKLVSASPITEATETVAEPQITPPKLPSPPQSDDGTLEQQLDSSSEKLARSPTPILHELEQETKTKVKQEQIVTEESKVEIKADDTPEEKLGADTTVTTKGKLDVPKPVAEPVESPSVEQTGLEPPESPIATLPMVPPLDIKITDETIIQSTPDETEPKSDTLVSSPRSSLSPEEEMMLETGSQKEYGIADSLFVDAKLLKVPSPSGKRGSDAKDEDLQEKPLIVGQKKIDVPPVSIVELSRAMLEDADDSDSSEASSKTMLTARPYGTPRHRPVSGTDDIKELQTTDDKSINEPMKAAEKIATRLVTEEILPGLEEAVQSIDPIEVDEKALPEETTEKDEIKSPEDKTETKPGSLQGIIDDTARLMSDTRKIMTDIASSEVPVVGLEAPTEKGSGTSTSINEEDSGKGEMSAGQKGDSKTSEKVQQPLCQIRQETLPADADGFDYLPETDKTVKSLDDAKLSDEARTLTTEMAKTGKTTVEPVVKLPGTKKVAPVARKDSKVKKKESSKDDVPGVSRKPLTTKTSSPRRERKVKTLKDESSKIGKQSVVVGQFARARDSTRQIGAPESVPQAEEPAGPLTRTSQVRRTWRKTDRPEKMAQPQEKLKPEKMKKATRSEGESDKLISKKPSETRATQEKLKDSRVKKIQEKTGKPEKSKKSVVESKTEKAGKMGKGREIDQREIVEGPREPEEKGIGEMVSLPKVTEIELVPTVEIKKSETSDPIPQKEDEEKKVVEPFSEKDEKVTKQETSELPSSVDSNVEAETSEVIIEKSEDKESIAKKSQDVEELKKSPVIEETTMTEVTITPEQKPMTDKDAPITKEPNIGEATPTTKDESLTETINETTTKTPETPEESAASGELPETHDLPVAIEAADQKPTAKMSDVHESPVEVPKSKEIIQETRTKMPSSQPEMVPEVPTPSTIIEPEETVKTSEPTKKSTEVVSESQPDSKNIQKPEDKAKSEPPSQVTSKEPPKSIDDDATTTERPSEKSPRKAAKPRREPETATVIESQSRYMEWYKLKREEMERKRQERKEGDEEEAKPKWLRKSQRQRWFKVGPDDRRIFDPTIGETTPRKSRKIKPLVNVESEQLKAIVRQGRALRKAQGDQPDEPQVQIFAPEKPPTPLASVPTSSRYHHHHHHLVQHSEYKYEKMPAAPFYLHPPPAPHSSPQISPQHYDVLCPEQYRSLPTDSRCPDEAAFDPGVVVQQPQQQTGAKLRHQQILEKKSVFDIAYSEAAPSHLRSDSTTPPS